MNKQHLLIASVALNVFLLAGGAFLSFRPKPVAPASLPPAVAAAPSFRWSEIKTDDLPTYAANLRRAGCPEATLKDIITAQIDQVYTAKATQLRNKAETAGLTPEALQTGENDLQRDRGEVLSQVLGISESSASSSEASGAQFSGGNSTPFSSAGSAQAFAGDVSPAAGTPVSEASDSATADTATAGTASSAPAAVAPTQMQLPEALRPLNPNLKLNSAQTASMKQQAQDFLTEVGTNPTPQRFQTAQQEAHNLFMIMNGATASLLQSASPNTLATP